MSAPSLERRLAVRLLLLHLLTLVATGGVYMTMAQMLGVDTDEGFEQSLHQVEASLHRVDGALLLRPTPRLLAMAGDPLFSVTVRDRAAGRTLALGTPPAEAEALFLLERGIVNLRDDRQGSKRRAVVRPAGGDAAPATVLIVRRLDGHDIAAWIEHEIFDEMIPLLGPLMLGSLLTIPLTVRGGLAGLRALSSSVAAVKPGDDARDLETAAVPREVEPLVAAVTRALARLQEALAQQRRFTANAAHELRTPLAVLLARLEALPESELRQALMRDVDRMTRIVGQLLSLAQLKAGSLMAHQPVDLGEVCIAVVADMAPLAISEGKEIAFTPPPQPIRRMGDPVALAEALSNLIDNALRHSPAGGSVTVSLDAAGAISVRDRGPGVPAALRQQVFEPFWSGDRGGGAGLGLAIVADIAAAHGGRVEVGDAPDGGADIRLFLPARAA